jgi:hypothetical protein
MPQVIINFDPIESGALAVVEACFELAVVVACSVEANNSDRVGDASGPCHYVAKPFQMGVAIRPINQLVNYYSSEHPTQGGREEEDRDGYSFDLGIDNLLDHRN